MIGWAHIAVGLCFIFGAVLIDIDHVVSCNWENINKAFNGEPNNCRRGFLHNPIIFWCLLALTIGLFIHLKMDNLILR